MSRPSAVLADPHPVFRAGMLCVLDSMRVDVVGETDDLGEAVELVDQHRPDLVVADVYLFECGEVWLESLRAADVAPAVLVVSCRDEALFAERCVRRGARGFVPKTSASDRIETAVRTVLSGDVYLGERAMERLLRRVHAGVSAQVDPEEALTARERQVFELLAAGAATRELAAELEISLKTVESHLANLRAKLGVEGSRDLRLLACAWCGVAGRA